MRKKGLTLLEILVSLVVFGIVISLTGSVIFRAYKDAKVQKESLIVLENLKWAMQFMANDIRLANRDDLHETLPPGGGWAWGHFKKLSFNIPNGSGGSDAVEYVITEDHKLTRSLNGGTAQELSNFIVANPNMAGFTRTKDHGSPKTNKVFQQFFIVEDSVVYLCLSVRPHPDQAEGSGNQTITLRTEIAPRNTN